MDKNDFYVPVSEVKTEGKFLKAICFKPKTAPIVCIVLGLLMFVPRILMLAILGLFFVVMSLLVLKFVSDYKVIDIFDQGIMIYGDKEAKTARFIPFEDITVWEAKRDNGHDMLEFTLKDEQKIVLNTFEADKAYRTLYGLIKEKEEKYIKAMKDREHALSFPDALDNIRKRFFKK